MRPDKPGAVTPEMLFGGSHPAFKPDQMPSAERCLCFELLGSSGGVWYVDVETGAVSRELEEAPSARLVMTAADFALLLDGKLPMGERMDAGEVRFVGDPARLDEFIRLLS